jgi:hypothetical protein
MKNDTDKFNLNPSYPHLDEIGWLVSHFAFTDAEAEYDPLPELPNRGAMWWKCVSRRDQAPFLAQV